VVIAALFNPLRRRGYPEAAEEVRTKLARLKELRVGGVV